MEQFAISEHFLATLFIVYGLRALKCSTSRMFAGKRLIGVVELPVWGGRALLDSAYLMQH